MNRAISWVEASLVPVPEGLKMVLRHYHNPADIAIVLDKKRAKKVKYVTLAWLVDPEHDTVEAAGMACCSKKDNPSRKLGRIIAHNRAIQNYFMPAEV